MIKNTIQVVIREAHLWSTYLCETKLQNQAAIQMGSSKPDFALVHLELSNIHENFKNCF